MASVEVAPSAIADLDALLATRDLPAGARARVLDRLKQLERFPESGIAMPPGPWGETRVLAGPWWFITIYSYGAPSDTVSVLAFLDARTTERERGPDA